MLLHTLRPRMATLLCTSLPRRISWTSPSTCWSTRPRRTPSQRLCYIRLLSVIPVLIFLPLISNTVRCSHRKIMCRARMMLRSFKPKLQYLAVVVVTADVQNCFRNQVNPASPGILGQTEKVRDFPRFSVPEFPVTKPSLAGKSSSAPAS